MGSESNKRNVKQTVNWRLIWTHRRGRIRPRPT